METNLPKAQPAPVPLDPDELGSFSALIAELEDGQFDRDLSAAMATILQRMVTIHQSFGGKPTARIHLTLDLALLDGIVQTRQNFRTDGPTEQRPTGQFFPTKSHTLSRRSQQVADLLGRRKP